MLLGKNTVEISLEVWYNMLVDARNLHFKALNEQIRNAGSTCTVQGCIGQRFIAAGMSGKNIIINGVPGNALGA